MIQKGSRVKIHYVLRVEGKVVDSSQGTAPFQYEHGASQILRGLERALEGLRAGDTKQVYVGPDDAYGPVKPEACVEVPNDQLGVKNPRRGMVLETKTESGQKLVGHIKEILDDKIIIDLNHPLAGKELYFEIKVLEVSSTPADNP